MFGFRLFVTFHDTFAVLVANVVVCFNRNLLHDGIHLCSVLIFLFWGLLVVYVVCRVVLLLVGCV